MADEDERRGTPTTQRRNRLVVGGVSVPISILVSYVVHDLIGANMGTEELVALSSVVGSVVSGVTLCFWDIRAIVLERFRARRASDILARRRRR